MDLEHACIQLKLEHAFAQQQLARVALQRDKALAGRQDAINRIVEHQKKYEILFNKYYKRAADLTAASRSASPPPSP